MSAFLGFRPANESDRGFIFSTWLKSYRYGSSFGRAQRNDIFFTEHHKVLEAILERKDTKALIAHDQSDPSHDFGYLISQPNTLHWLYVKEDLRRHGIASALLIEANINPNEVALSHVSDDYYKFLKKRWPSAIYNHYRQFRESDERPAGLASSPSSTDGRRADRGPRRDANQRQRPQRATSQG